MNNDSLKLRFLLFALVIVTTTLVGSGIGQTIDEVPPKIGKLGRQLNEPVVIEGIVVEGPFKGFEGGPNIIVHKIDGKATQSYVQLPLSVSEKLLDESNGNKSTKLDHYRFVQSTFAFGKWFRLTGVENGEFVGGGPANVQTTRRYFRHQFQVAKYQLIQPIVFSPRDFEQQECLLEGVARQLPGHPNLLVGDGWLLTVNRDYAWPERMIGRRVEVLGVVEPVSQGQHKTEASSIRLVRLEDQIGQAVSLRGTALSLNSSWCLDYRGQTVLVENMSELPGWNSGNHGRPVEISGILKQQNSPKDFFRPSRYLVTNASWKPIPKLLLPERAELHRVDGLND